MKKIHLRSLGLTRRVHLYPRLEISVLMDISVLAFYGYIGYIGDISDISEIYRWLFLYEYRYIEN